MSNLLPDRLTEQKCKLKFLLRILSEKIDFSIEETEIYNATRDYLQKEIYTIDKKIDYEQKINKIFAYFPSLIFLLYSIYFLFLYKNVFIALVSLALSLLFIFCFKKFVKLKSVTHFYVVSAYTVAIFVILLLTLFPGINTWLALYTNEITIISIAVTLLGIILSMFNNS